MGIINNKEDAKLIKRLRDRLDFFWERLDKSGDSAGGKGSDLIENDHLVRDIQNRLFVYNKRRMDNGNSD